MSNPIIKIVDLETGTEIEREMNAEELAKYEIDQLAEIERKANIAAKAAAKAALLERLGITEEEAKLLLG